MIFTFRKSTQSLLLVAAVIGSAGRSHAQSNFGAVRGIVSDGVGASIDRAPVTLTSQGTKISRTTISNSAGEYVFNAVDPGTYNVTVSVTDGGNGNSSQSIVPYLPLSELTPRRPASPAAGQQQTGGTR